MTELAIGEIYEGVDDGGVARSGPLLGFIGTGEAVLGDEGGGFSFSCGRGHAVARGSLRKEDSHEKHRLRHVALHSALDELVADFLIHNRNRLPSATAVIELVEWSHRQTKDPAEPGGVRDLFLRGHRGGLTHSG